MCEDGKEAYATTSSRVEEKPAAYMQRPFLGLCSTPACGKARDRDPHGMAQETEILLTNSSLQYHHLRKSCQNATGNSFHVLHHSKVTIMRIQGRRQPTRHLKCPVDDSQPRHASSISLARCLEKLNSPERTISNHQPKQFAD